jgi:hypothetical protein
VTTLSFDLFYRDHGAQRGMRELASTTDRTHASFGKLAQAVSAIAVGGAIVKFGKDSVRAYADAQKSQASLAFAFQKFPKLADTNQQALQGLNSELQKKTRFDDDALASGQSVLAQFNLTGRQITQVTPLLADYAAKTGQDIPTAAKNVGRALLGNTRALKAIGIDYKSTGDRGKDFANVTDLMRQKIGGFAEAEGKTASGRLAILKNQFGELEEAAGKRLLPALTGIVGGLTTMVEWIGRNERTIGPLFITVGGLATGMFVAKKAVDAWRVSQDLMGGLASKAVGGLRAMKLAFTGVELSAKGAGRAMRVAELSIPVVGIALFGVTEILSHFASKGDDATQTTNDFSDAMKSVKGNVTLATVALDENVRAVAVNALQAKGAYEQAKLLGISFGTVTDAALGNKDAIAEVNDVTTRAAHLNPQLSKSNRDLSNAAVGLSGSLIGQATNAKAAAEAERVRRGAMAGGSIATTTLATLTDKLTGKEKSLATQLQVIINKFTILKKGALDQAQADIAWEASIDGVTSSVKSNGRSLDIHTDKGRQNRQSIIAAITALNDKTTADVKNAGATRKGETATDTYSRVLRVATQDTKHGEAQIRAAARAAGLNERQVNAMIRQYLKTPKQVATDVRTRGVRGTLNDIHHVQNALGHIHNKTVDIKFSTNAYKIGKTKFAVNLTSPSSVGRSAAGGLIRGPGSGTSDSILGLDRGGMVPTSWVSNGEFVVNAKQTGKHRAMLEAINAGIDGYASGGTVGRSLTVRSGHLPASAWQLSGAANWFSGAFARAAGNTLGQGLAAGLRSLFAVTGVGSSRKMSWKGGTFTERFVNTLKAAEMRAHAGFSIFQGGWRPATRASGTSHRGDAVDLAPITAAVVHALRLSGVAAWRRGPRQGFTPHIHGVPLPGFGWAGGSGIWQAQNYLAGGDGLGGRDYEARVPRPTAVSGGASVSGGVKSMAQQLLRLHGWEAQFPALNYIINHESGWNVHARNPSSGAYGLGQALPASKMAPYGGDYRDSANTQLRWMLAYIGGRYGDPNGAASFWRAHHWYDKGGYLRPGLTLAYNGTGRPERVLNAGETRRYEQYRGAGGSGGGAPTINITLNAPNYVGTPRDLEKALVNSARTGALRGMLLKAGVKT